jgi:hypothetical protein
VRRLPDEVNRHDRALCSRFNVQKEGEEDDKDQQCQYHKRMGPCHVDALAAFLCLGGERHKERGLHQDLHGSTFPPRFYDKDFVRFHVQIHTQGERGKREKKEEKKGRKKERGEGKREKEKKRLHDRHTKPRIRNVTETDMDSEPAKSKALAASQKPSLFRPCRPRSGGMVMAARARQTTISGTWMPNSHLHPSVSTRNPPVAAPSIEPMPKAILRMDWYVPRILWTRRRG